MGGCRRLWALLLLLWCFLGRCLGQDGTFQISFILNATAEREAAKVYNRMKVDDIYSDRGYQVFMERYAELYPEGFTLGNGPHKFHLNYSAVRYESTGGQSLAEVVNNQVATGAHFLVDILNLGLEDLAEDLGRITLSCCDQRDLKGHRENYFQMTPPSESSLYTILNLFVLQGVRNVSTIYPNDNPFYSYGCKRALEVFPEFESSGLRAASLHTPSFSDLNRPETMRQIIAELREASSEVVAACITHEQARLLVEEQWQAKLPLKVRFFADGPANKTWVDKLGPKALDTMTFTGWHQSANFTNLTFFDSIGDFISRLDFGKMDIDFRFPAQASSMFVLLTAVQRAFEGCNTTATGGNVSALLNDTSAISCKEGKALGYERIHETLELTDVERTVYGRVSFDRNHRNAGLGEVLTQVVNNSGSYDISVVYPVLLANNTHELKIPGSNPFKPEKCPEGSFRGLDEFDPCPKCPLGTFSNALNNEFCLECHVDEYSKREEGQTECIQCPGE